MTLDKTVPREDELDLHLAMELPERDLLELDTHVTVITFCNTCNVAVVSCQLTLTSCNVWQIAYL